MLICSVRLYSPNTQVKVLAQGKWDSLEAEEIQKMMGMVTRPSQETLELLA